VGFIIHKKIGDWVEKGEPIFEIHYNKKENINWIEENLGKVFILSENQLKISSLILERIKPKAQPNCNTAALIKDEKNSRRYL
ncbi:MAG: hypothetical protein ACE5WD_14965, partial [Candidatus Aminicenantia bacterium]